MISAYIEQTRARAICQGQIFRRDVASSYFSHSLIEENLTEIAALRNNIKNNRLGGQRIGAQGLGTWTTMWTSARSPSVRPSTIGMLERAQVQRGDGRTPSGAFHRHFRIHGHEQASDCKALAKGRHSGFMNGERVILRPPSQYLGKGKRQCHVFYHFG